MQDNYFDRIVREKLTAMEVPLEPSDWEAFADQLSAALDALFREKLEQATESYDPAEWELMEAMLDAPFDRIVGEKLRAMTAPFMEADWEALEAALEAPFDALVRDKFLKAVPSVEESDWAAMEAVLDESFDGMIREKLLDTALPLETPDWAAMEAALYHPFDRAIRDQLAEASLPVNSGDWELMHARLNTPFDQAIREKLDAHHEPFYKSDWRRMAALLGGGRLMPFYRDWRSYAAAAILLLLLLAGDNWRKEEGLPQLTRKKAPAVIEAAPEETDLPASPPAALTFSDPRHKKEKSFSTPPLAHTDTATSPEKESGENETLALPNVQVGPAKQIAVTVPPVPATVGEGTQPALAAAPAQQDETSPSRQVFSLKSIRLQDQQSGMGLLGYSRQDAGRSASIELPQPPPYPKVGVSLYGAGFTSVSQFNDRGKPGFATGLRVDLILSDNWSLVSGLLYAEKQFSRTVFNSVPSDNGMGAALTPTYSFWISRLEAEYVLLEIPVMARYTFRNESPVSFYLQAGFTTMLSLKESYRHYDPLSASNVSATQNNPLVDPSAYSAALEAYISQLDPTAEERKISTYIGNLQLGPGLEIGLTPQLQLQLEPYLQLGILPMGAQNLKMHSAGIGMGLRYLLDKP